MLPSVRTHIIGLTGFAGAGKDTVADLLVAHARFRKLAFADALRAGMPIQAGDVEVSARLPDWTGLSFPEESAEAPAQ